MSAITVQVAASTDDARNLTPNGTFNATNTTYRLGDDAGVDQFCGWRWLGITVPQGATITSAILDLFSAQTGMGTTANVIFYGEKSSNAATFSNSTAGKPEGRTRTTANVPVSVNVSTFNTASSFGNVLFDVTTLVQEIVNQVGWSSGNALALVGHNNASAASNNIGFATWDASGNLKGAKLTINYTVGSSPQNLTLPLIASTALLFAPILSQVINLPHIPSTTTLFSPSVSFGGVTLQLPHIPSTEQVYAPAVAPGAVTLQLPHIPSTEQVYAPTVAPSNQLLLPHIPSTEQVYAPAVAPGAVTLQLPHIPSTEQVYAPALAVGALVLVLPHIPSTEQVYSPTVRRQIDPNELPVLGVG